MRLINLIFILVIIFAGFGCGLRVGEQTSLFKDIEGFSVGCLNGINEKVELYKKNQLNTNQINQLSNCMKMALMVFKNRVRGRKKGEFTPGELRKFIQDLFLQDQIISDTFLNQLVKLKTVIIGGSEDKLTEMEIESFITFVEVLRKEAIFFQPYIQILNVLYNGKQLNEKTLLKDPGKDLKKSIGRVSVFLNKFSTPYFITDVKKLFQEVNVFLDSKYDTSQLDQKFALFSAFKQFIVDGSDKVIHPNEWENILLGCVYFISMSVNYSLLKGQSVFISPTGMQYISMIFNNLLDFLSLSVKNHSGHLITESYFLKLALSIKSANLIPEKIRNESLYNLLFILFGKVFNVDKNKYGVIELTPHQISKMRNIIQLWGEIQNVLDDMFNKKNLKENIINSTKINSFFSSKEMLSMGKDIISQMMLLKPLYREGRKIHLSNSLFKAASEHESSFEAVEVEGSVKEDDKTILPERGKTLDVKTSTHLEKREKFTSSYYLDYKNLTIYNLYYLIATMIRSGYEKDYYLKNQGMTQAELRNFFIDFNPIADDMGWFQNTEGRVLAEGEAEFMAANMLTATAKGFDHDWSKEEYLTSNEITEYIAYAFSFGFSLQELEAVIWDKCGNGNSPGNDDQKKPNKYVIDCVRIHLVPTLKKIMNNMPDFQKVLERMTKEEKKDFTESLIHISYETEEEYQKAAYLDGDHLKNIVMALYFVETTMSRYDLNGDFVVHHDEIWAAFPTFRGYLSHILVYLLCRESDDWREAVYAYVIARKSLPTSKDLAIYEKVFALIELNIHDILKSWNIQYWDLLLDRKELIMVFSALIKGFLAKKKERVSEQCFDHSNTEPITFDDESILSH